MSIGNISPELTGVFQIDRTKPTKMISTKRFYDVLSIRLSGEADFFYKKKTIHVNEKGILFIPGETEYSQTTDGETIIAVHFLNYNNEGFIPFGFYHIIDIERIKDLFIKMNKIWDEKKKGYKLLATSVFYEILYHFDTAINETDANVRNNPLKNAIEFIHKYYKSKNISVKYLADISFVSETNFRRIFKKTYGVSPKEYIISLKLEYAVELIESNHFRIKEISKLSGFSNPKYFARCFKQHFGVSPSKYISFKSIST